MKVSFDFDGTLSRPDVQEYAKELIESGIEVIVTTARFDDENAYKYSSNPGDRDLYEVPDELGIKRENIYFTNMEDKIDHLHKDTLWHLDDDDYELEEIKKSKLITQGVDVNRSDWRRNCDYFLIVAMVDYLSMQKN